MDSDVIFYVNIFLLAISILQVLANLVVLTAYFRSSQCRRTDTIILLVSLASIDFLYALLFIPYVVYLLVESPPHDVNYNYNAVIILATGGPPAALMKSGCVITSFIAIDRIVAVYFPAKYYRLEKRKIMHCAFVIALMMATIDGAVLFGTTKIASHPQCSTFACFTSPFFQTYWGMSNMAVNVLSSVLTFIVLVGLHRALNSTMLNRSLERKRKADNAATRTAVCILVISMIFGVVPGLINGFAAYIELPLLKNVGFFVGTCASVSGLSHAFIFGMAHRDVRSSIMAMFLGKTLNSKSASMGNSIAALDRSHYVVSVHS
ncbi:hypothetical protein Tcan_02690 [Toxocara canis]|uniref:G-protein coupled receptors family 1 profile domain-containing protein n=2 Tax=Toxocara canis TaxID=6265 RepID=A0A0B2VI45_TOXCA|nr:hypothetical protein Tcan_02690 [Toxocara canis]VDM43291.1 unnamed protein product [Toxocara canis]